MIHLPKNSKEMVICVMASCLVAPFIACLLRLPSLVTELLVIRTILGILFNHKTMIILNPFVTLTVINN